MKDENSSYYTAQELCEKWRVKLADIYDFIYSRRIRCVSGRNLQFYFEPPNIEAVSKGLFPKDSVEAFEKQWPGFKQENDIEKTKDTPPDKEKFITKNHVSQQSQISKEKCRDVAKELLKENQNITIADAIRSDKMAVASEKGTKGDMYTDAIIRGWINDLFPNNKPGRRPKQ